MKKNIECLLLGLVLIICIAIYQGAKVEGKGLGNKLKAEGKAL